MLKTDTQKGYFFAILATFTGSAVYIFSKAALEEISLPQFGVYWFLMGIIWNSLFHFRKKENRKIPQIPNVIIKILLLLGFLEIIATVTLYAAIFVTTDASIPSFLRNLEFIFVAILGVILLRERFTYIEIVGVFLTIIGAIIISYHKNMTFKAYITGTSGLMLISSVAYAIRTIIAKTHIKFLSPTALALNRAVFILVFSLIALLIVKDSFVIPSSAFINVALGAFFGPFLTSTSQYSALKYIEVSKASIIQSITPLFVLWGGFIYFGRMPLNYQIFGGILTIAGTVVLILGKHLFKKHN